MNTNIFFNGSIWLIDELWQVLSLQDIVDLGVMVVKGYSILFTSLEQEPHHQMLISFITRKSLWGGVGGVLLSRGYCECILGPTNWVEWIVVLFAVSSMFFVVFIALFFYDLGHTFRNLEHFSAQRSITKESYQIEDFLSFSMPLLDSSFSLHLFCSLRRNLQLSLEF